MRDIIEILASFIRFSQRNPGSYIDPERNRSVEEKCDILMNKQGVIVKRYSSFINPMSKKIQVDIEKYFNYY